jgi:ATP-binding cassette, subfamily C (CFTR/MRP), member 1
MVITSIVEASVAVGRLTSFLQAEEIQPDAIIVKEAPEEMGEETVVLRNATFSWNRHESKTALRDIDFRAYKGELSCIVGRVGAGKSSFLQSILGDLWKVNGSVEVSGTVAYVAQQQWILNATVKENIVFGYRYDSNFYEQTVKACALLDDFNQLPDGDETVVGERGISLSGGQKARVALARAVYARADIYLLDDVLSAVDSHVGRHIIENVLGPRGLLNTKTRILATNAMAVLKEASYITMIKEGEIAERGTYKQLVAMKGLVAELLKTGGHDKSGSSSSAASPTRSGSETSTIIEAESSQNKDDLEDIPEDAPITEPIKASLSTTPKKRTGSMATLRRASTASFRGPRGKLTDEEVSGSRTKQAKEHMEQGKVKWEGKSWQFVPLLSERAETNTHFVLVYIEYAKMSNLGAVAIYFVTLIAAHAASVGKSTSEDMKQLCQHYYHSYLATVVNSSLGGSVWLKKWAEDNQDAGENNEVGKYIGIYFAFGIGSALLTVVLTLILWIFCSIEVSPRHYASSEGNLTKISGLKEAA